MNIIIIAYRPDYTEYCRGCRMGSTESDMLHGVFDNVEDASDFLAYRMEFNAVEDRYEYSEYDFTYFINGEEVECDQCDTEANTTIYNELIVDAQKKADKFIIAYNEKEAMRKEKETKEKAERIKEQELKTLAKLQKKHGTS